MINEIRVFSRIVVSLVINPYAPSLEHWIPSFSGEFTRIQAIPWPAMTNEPHTEPSNLLRCTAKCLGMDVFWGNVFQHLIEGSGLVMPRRDVIKWFTYWLYNHTGCWLHWIWSLEFSGWHRKWELDKHLLGGNSRPGDQRFLLEIVSLRRNVTNLYSYMVLSITRRSILSHTE